MKNLLGALFITLSCLSSPANADPKADAEYIVSVTVTREVFEGALIAQRPMLISALQHDLQSNGITLPDPDKFFDLFVNEFIEEFTNEMRAQSAPIYLNNFSEEQLADITAFLKTDSGKAYVAMTPVLMQEGARLGAIAGQQAGQNAGKRLAERIEKEGLIVVEDKSLMSRLLDVLK